MPCSTGLSALPLSLKDHLPSSCAPKSVASLLLQVQYFSFEGGVMERTLAATSLGEEAERSARGRLVKAALGGESARATPGQPGAESLPDSREGQPAQPLPRPRSRHDQALYDIITGGVLIIHVRIALHLPLDRSSLLLLWCQHSSGAQHGHLKDAA